jgi:hypothetical protein
MSAAKNATGCAIVYHNLEDNTYLIGRESLYIIEGGKKLSDAINSGFEGKNIPIEIILLDKERIDITLEMIESFKTHRASFGYPEGPFLVPPLRCKGQSIRYPTTNSYEARTRKPGFNISFIKGGIEIDCKTRVKETPLQCIQREIFEEIGKLSENLLPDDGTEKQLMDDYMVFIKDIHRSDANTIMNAINERNKQHIGEMFDMKFMKLSEIEKLQLNLISKSIIRYLRTREVAGAAPSNLRSNAPIFVPRSQGEGVNSFQLSASANSFQPSGVNSFQLSASANSFQPSGAASGAYQQYPGAYQGYQQYPGAYQGYQQYPGAAQGAYQGYQQYPGSGYGYGGKRKTRKVKQTRKHKKVYKKTHKKAHKKTYKKAHKKSRS